jgi:hypothetical protein
VLPLPFLLLPPSPLLLLPTLLLLLLSLLLLLLPTLPLPPQLLLLLLILLLPKRGALKFAVSAASSCAAWVISAGRCCSRPACCSCSSNATARLLWGSGCGCPSLH